MRAEIDFNSQGYGPLRLDGHDVSKGVRGFRLESEAGMLPLLELDVLLVYGFRLSGEVDVVIPDAARDLLVQLGWTPPEGKP